MMYQKYIKYGAIAVAIIIADQITKWMIANTVTYIQVIPVIPGFFNLVHIQNPGSAFGLFANYNSLVRNIFLMSTSIIAICFVVYLFVKAPQEYPFLAVGLALIFGGAIGNMIDRFRLGSVIDFLDFYIGRFHWPAFNVADSAITIGMIIFIFYTFFRSPSV